MLKLRPYKPCDAATVLSWCNDEVSFKKWTADRYPAYPITADDMNKYYFESNGGCTDPDNFFPMTAFDESGVVGHLIMRFTDESKTVLRFGFIIVDTSIRGKGYGKSMIQLALKYAFEILKVKKVTIGVFENNPAARNCYKSVGFKDSATKETTVFNFFGETWNCLELEYTK